MEFPTNYFMINNEEQESVSSDWERIRAVVASVREEAAKVIVGPVSYTHLTLPTT